MPLLDKKNQNNLIYQNKTKGINLLIYESNPCICPVTYRTKSFDYSNYTERIKDKIYSISLPYIQCYVVNGRYDSYSEGNGIQVYFSTTQKPVKSLTDDIFRLPLPNVTLYDGHACLYGGYEIDINKESKETNELYGYRLFTSFFASPFNNELGNRRGFGLKRWDQQTKENPSFILTSTLPQYKNMKKFTDMINFLEKDEDESGY